MATPTTSQPDGAHRLIASGRHLTLMLAIQAAVVLWGFYLQQRPGASVIPQNRNILPVYLSGLALEWGWARLVYVGIKRRGVTLWEIVGGRWKSWKDVASDVLLYVPLLFVCNAIAFYTSSLLGPRQAKSVASLLPRSPWEVVLWIALSISAGICEEIVYRGYFQKQFAAYTRNLSAAVLLQGILFGMAHSYQGWKRTVVVTVLGILYGLFAACRRNLRANMMVHAWSDVWSGWLSRVVS